MSDFVALDVKLANLNLASICELAVARYTGGACSELWHSLVDPKDYFDPFCVAQHGIDGAAVAGQPTFEELVPLIFQRLEHELVVTYTAFDRTSLTRALRECMDTDLQCGWLDAARVVRRTWHDLSHSGYGLLPVAAKLCIPCLHNRAADHAVATAEVLLRALATSGIALQVWRHRVDLPISSDGQFIARPGNPEGPLHGEVVVFTGALAVTRAEAAAISSDAGCEVDEGVTKRTTILVVGDQDLRHLAGYTKSAKHRKAEQLVAKGQHIRILFERDFYSTVVPQSAQFGVRQRRDSQG